MPAAIEIVCCSDGGTVFGGPTRPGGPAWRMKRHDGETSSRRRDGPADGRASSGSRPGATSLFRTLAGRHGMVRSSRGRAPANMGDDGPEDGSQPGGIAPARDHGSRSAALAAVLSRGRRGEREAA
jgi:hypothetical protein